MCVGSPTAGTWSSSQWRPDDEFETDRWPETGHREGRRLRLWVPSLDPRDETEGACELYAWFGSAAITMGLGSMATGLSREWMSTPAKNERAHGSLKRMRCDDVRPFYHRCTRGEASIDRKIIATGARRSVTAASRPRPTRSSLPRFATIPRRPIACDSVLVRIAISCFIFQSLTRASAERLLAVRSHRAVAESSWQSARVRGEKHGQIRASISSESCFEDSATNARQSCARTSAGSRAASAESDNGQPWRDGPRGRAWGQAARTGGGSFTPRFTIDRQRTGGTMRRPSSARPMRSTAEVAVLHGVKHASPLETRRSSD
jgi:hypothetical protein